MPTILIMDRDVARRERLVSLSRRIDPGIHIEAFLKPEPAFSWLSWHSADLVISDRTMPRMTGFELAERIKTIRPDIPIILCTSKGNESDKFWGQQQGANAHIVKPFKGEELLAAVKRVLG